MKAQPHTQSEPQVIEIPNQPFDLLGHLLPDELAYPDIDFTEVPLIVDPVDGLKLRLPLNKMVVRFHASWNRYEKTVSCTAYTPGVSVRCFNLEFAPSCKEWAKTLAAVIVDPMDTTAIAPNSYPWHRELLCALGGLLGRIVRKNLEAGNFSDTSAS